MRLVCLLICVSLCVACSPQAALPTQTVLPASPSPTDTIQSAVTPTIRASPTALQVLSCEDWQFWPAVPIVTERARELYQRGQGSGNNTHAFSKIGDGEISTEWFFTAFDLGEGYYDLGSYRDLQSV